MAFKCTENTTQYTFNPSVMNIIIVTIIMVEYSDIQCSFDPTYPSVMNIIIITKITVGLYRHTI